jgi:hypothetical protein
MKKLGFAILALTAISIALPTIASAETIVVKHGGHMHRDWHPHHHDRMVVIKHRH